MKTLDNYLSNLRKFSFIISFFLIYGSIVEIDSKCKLKIIKNKASFCKFSSLISKPQNTFTQGAIDFARILKTKSTSRLLSTNIKESQQRFKEYKSGFNFNFKKGERPSSGFLLLSHGDPEKKGIPSFELWDLNNQKKLKKWNLKKAIKFVENKSKQKVAYFKNPLILKDKSLVFNSVKSGSFLIKIDNNGDITGFNDKYYFHHSLNLDSNGLIYACITKKDDSLNTQNSDEGPSPDEGFAILDENLNIISTHFIKDIYKDNGLESRLFSSDAGDPIHINDVEPYQIDRDEVNNVLISLRSTSSVLNYDLKSKKIIWVLDGLTYRQHDVDILNANPLKISIFDNNIFRGVEPKNKILFVENLPVNPIDQGAEITFISPNSKSIKTSKIIFKEEDFKDLEKYLRPRTSFGGLSEYNKNYNTLIVEEENHGRVFEFDILNKKILWTYINSSSEDNIFYRLMWSRHYESNPLI